jgi:transposase
VLSCLIPLSDTGQRSACCRLWAFHDADRDQRPQRYPSDTTDAQWQLIDRLLPDPAWPAGKGGRRESRCRREIVDAIFYLVDNGIKWRALPADFPPWSTVYNYFAAWEATGASQGVLDVLRVRVRLREGRVAEPTAAVIDSASGTGWPAPARPGRPAAFPDPAGYDRHHRPPHPRQAIGAHTAPPRPAHPATRPP